MMSCPGCPEKSKGLPNVDSRGNIIDNHSEMGNYEKEVYNTKPSNAKPIQNMTYAEYMKGREEVQKRSRKLGDEMVKKFTPDYKRIQIQELIDIYNHEEVSRLTPTQALVGLWELVHHKEYQNIIMEFENLSEQVDKKYLELIEDKIIIKWKP